MKIQKQAIISWLLNEKDLAAAFKITFPNTRNEEYNAFFQMACDKLNLANSKSLNWGLPEVVMPSFYKMMAKSSKSFLSIESELFKEFCKNQECGIILIKPYGTLVYCFDKELLQVWLFREISGYSFLYLYFTEQPTEDRQRLIGALDNLHSVTALPKGSSMSEEDYYSQVVATIYSYLAVKKFAPVETIVVPNKKVDYIKNLIRNYPTKEVINNESGQDVIIMDSRWFRKIVNDNDIFVRGYWRLHKKNDDKGEYTHKLIWVNPYVRHGYHRNALIEMDEEKKNLSPRDNS